MMVELRAMGFVRTGEKHVSGRHRIKYHRYYREVDQIEIWLARECDGNARVGFRDQRPVVLASEQAWHAFRDLHMTSGEAADPVVVLDN